MKFKWFIGIDVSKRTFDIAMRINKEGVIHRRYSNDKLGFKSFTQLIRDEKIELKDALICLEHTGVYSSLLLRFLDEKSANIWIENALTIKRSLGIQRGKSDRVDAIRIAEYAYRFKDKCALWKPARKQVSILKALISLRFRLIKTKKTLRAPLQELEFTKTIGSKEIQLLTAPVLKAINAELLEVEEQIEKLIADDSHLQRLQDIITSVDGVGKVTAWQMIATTNEFKDFKSGRQFACYSGVVPFDHSSGTSIYAKPKVSNLANKKMKELLHMSALSATVMKGDLNDYYNRKVEEGKNKMLVLNNVRNKLVQRIFACVNENRKYEKSYVHSLV